MIHICHLFFLEASQVDLREEHGERLPCKYFPI